MEPEASTITTETRQYISLQKPCSALQGLVLTLKSFREPQNQLFDSVNPSLMSFISHLMSVRVVHQL